MLDNILLKQHTSWKEMAHLFSRYMKRFPKWEQSSGVHTTQMWQHLHSGLQSQMQICSSIKFCRPIYAQDHISPGLQYFEAILGSDVSLPMSAFKPARLFSPFKWSQLPPMWIRSHCYHFLVTHSTTLKQNWHPTSLRPRTWAQDFLWAEISFPG